MDFPKYRTLRSIVSDVEDYFSLPPGELVDRSAAKTLLKARKLAAVLARDYADASWPEIGDILHRDHSTIMHLCKSSKVDIKTIKPIFDDLYASGWVNPRS